jgi:membrane-associated protease RseP (regulator of RpoE activity)
LSATDPLPHLLAIASEVMAVDDYSMLARPIGGVSFRGKLMAEPSVAEAAVSERLVPLRYMALLERVNGREVLTFIPNPERAYRTRPRLALVLLVLTVLSTLFVGASMVQPSYDEILRHPFSGWPFALSLMLILGVHEMGHFVVARRFGVHVSLPYFIPMPFGPFGTMGAFINMTSPPRDRRQVLRIGLAGPLSGLVVGLVVLAYGLSISHVTVMPPGASFYREGNSLLYMAMKYAVFHRWLPSGNVDVDLNPVAFAGWAGLLVTGLNLIPAAQLDGGHVAYALFGRRTRYLTLAIGLGMVAMGFVWQGWWLWAALILLLGSRREVVLDEITSLRPREVLVAIAGLVLFVLLFVPVPLVIV